MQPVCLTKPYVFDGILLNITFYLVTEIYIANLITEQLL